MNRREILKYSLLTALGWLGFSKKATANHDKELLNVFKDIVVVEEDGKVYKVPIMWETYEQTLDCLKHGDFILPFLNIYQTDKTHYVLDVRTLYKEEMNQILEQIIMKFNPLLNIGAKSYKLETISQGINVKDALQINRYIFNLSVVA